MITRARLALVLALIGLLTTHPGSGHAQNIDDATLAGEACSTASVETIPRSRRSELHRIAYEAIRRSLGEVVNALGSAGGDSFQVRMTMARRSSDGSRGEFRLEGTARLPVRLARHPVVRSLENESALPMRNEFTGFLVVSTPADLLDRADDTPVPVEIRLEFQVRLEACLESFGSQGMSSLLTRTDAAWGTAISHLAARLPAGSLRPFLVRLFPELFQIGAKRTAGQFLDRLLRQGKRSPGKLVARAGLVDLLNFAMCFGFQLLRDSIAGPVPAIGATAVQACLVMLTLRQNGVLTAAPIELVQEGWCRDRFAKADGFLMGTYLPGQSQLRWIEDQIIREAGSDSFGTLHRLLFFLRSREPVRRGFWSPFVDRIRPIIAARAQEAEGLLPEKYLGMLDMLFPRSGDDFRSESK